MQKIWDVIVTTIGSSVIAFLTPTTGFMYALVIMFLFNIWCGMRADGVSVKGYKNFSFKKIGHALGEFLLYLMIIQTVYSFMTMIGDGEEGIIVVKTITYVFAYMYLQNAFKNLIRAYPLNKALRMVYHIIRFEFKKALPSHIQEVVDKIESEVDKEIEKEKNNETNK